MNLFLVNIENDPIIIGPSKASYHPILIELWFGSSKHCSCWCPTLDHSPQMRNSCPFCMIKILSLNSFFLLSQGDSEKKKHSFYGGSWSSKRSIFCCSSCQEPWVSIALVSLCYSFSLYLHCPLKVHFDWEELYNLWSRICVLSSCLESAQVMHMAVQANFLTGSALDVLCDENFSPIRSIDPLMVGLLLYG